MARRHRPISEQVAPATLIHLLAARPELRDVFPIAALVDAVVREGV